MAIETPLQSGGGGAYGEGNAFQALEELKEKRRQLNEGELGIEQFLDEGKRLARFIISERDRLGGAGSGQATVSTNLTTLFENADTGFGRIPGEKDPTIELPPSFQQQVREALLPENITGEERERLLKDIPFDIGFDTDRFDIEREAIRQRQRAQEALAEERVQRSESLGVLGDLLQQQQAAQFTLNVPRIREDAQAAGLFRTTGLADALAREQARLTEQTGFRLGEAALLDRAADVQAQRDILANQLAIQQSGLQRDFSLEDFTRQTRLAKELAALSAPQSGRSSGGKAAGTLSGAATGAGIGTSISPGIGTAIGAGVGGVLGGATSRGK